MASLEKLDLPINVAIKQAALADLKGQEAATTKLEISHEIFPQGHVFNLVDSRLTVRQNAALVFLDHSPGANWGHPCTYRFFDPATGGHLWDEPALFPPNLAGDLKMESFHAPLFESPTAPHLIFPTIPHFPIPFPLPHVVAEQRYAILWTSQISNRRHVEDLEFFWRTLVHVYNFDPANIFVLCFNGTLGATDVSGPIGNWAGNNTPYQMKVNSSATVANLQAVLNTLAGKLKTGDLLLVHTNNHGAPSGLCVDSSSVVTPAQFGTMIAGLPHYHTLIVTMEQCFSGAFQDPTLQKSTAANTVFASAVPATSESAGAAHFDPWALCLTEALNGATPAGGALPTPPPASTGGKVSIKGACDWAKAHDPAAMDNPQYGDKPAGCGGNISLAGVLVFV
jgi:hypothetical protein